MNGGFSINLLNSQQEELSESRQNLYLEKLIASAQHSHENENLDLSNIRDDPALNTKNRTSPDFIKEGIIDLDTHEKIDEVNNALCSPKDSTMENH